MPSSNATMDAATTLTFYLNATKITLENPDPDTTLLQYVRSIGLTGSKLGCAEGGCGACTVLVSCFDKNKNKVIHTSVNGCLAPLVSMDGKHVITIEGIGTSENPHPTQERIGQMFGSQCGFCTPGIVMSLYALLRNNPTPTEQEIEESFDGNLCRCTGYRPILDAAKTFAVDSCCKNKLPGANGTECGKGSACCRVNGTGGTNGKAANGHTENGANGSSQANANGNANGTNGSDIPKKGCGIANCCQSKESSNQSDDHLNFPDFPPVKFKKHDPSQELIFPPSLMRHEPKLLCFTSENKKWFRPTTVDQFTALKKEYPNAKVVAGNSEVGIEVKFKKMHYQVCIYASDIEELKKVEWTKDGVTVGANLTLSEFEKVAHEGIQKFGTDGKQVFEAFMSNLKYFAGTQIRNVATLAGNIATASPISDFNPIFIASESVLSVLRPSDGTVRKEAMATFFRGYRKTALEPEDILLSIHIPAATSATDYIRAYKQAHRKDDDIAIANAALRAVVDPESLVVTKALLAFGGLGPTTVRALKAEESLVGKKWGDPTVLEKAMTALAEEDFNLPYGVPGGMPVYRKSLALGFFYRFWNDVGSQVSIKLHGKASSIQFDQGAIRSIEREVSRGRRLYDDKIPKDRIIGKPMKHLAAMKQVTGEAVYIDDMPKREDEAYGALVMSTKAHAKILFVDPSSALAADGVVGFISGKDIPGSNLWCPPAMDEPFFAMDNVEYIGQTIGVIVAETQAQAQRAARLVKIEYEELPHILTIEEAIEAESFFPPVKEIVKGDVEAAFKVAAHVFEGETRMGGQEHFYLETNAVLAIPGKEDDEMEIFSSTQNPTETQTFVSGILGIPANRVVCRIKRMGGAFGGKETRSVALAAVMALAARKTSRPVRCMLDRDEDMLISGQRHPFLGKWKVGLSKEGKILALKLRMYNNGGWSQDLSGAVLERSLFHSDGCYMIPNVDLVGRICKTNIHSNTAFRGFGGPQGMFVCEAWMHEVADRLNMPVEKLREINFYKEGEITHFNQTLEDWYVPELYEQVMRTSEYTKRRIEVDEFNKTNKWRKQGISICPTKFGISFTALFLNQAGALVHIYHDGSILVAHGGTEMGQGLHTKMAMVAAQELKVPLESVYINETSTNTVPNSSATAASASSDLNGMAIKNACDQINERLKPYREKNPNANMKELAHMAYFDRVSLSSTGFYKTPEIGYVWGENKGKAFAYFTLGACVSQVEMDVLTGDHTILRTDLLMDVGNTLNSAIDVGQIEGGFTQGFGLFTMEETLFLQNGALFTRGPGAYKIPGFRDVPQDLRIGLFQGKEYKSLRTIGRSKGIGEPPLALGFSVFFALRDAIKSARKDAGVTDTLVLQSPATAERIRLACGDRIVQKAAEGVKQQSGEKGYFVYV